MKKNEAWSNRYETEEDIEQSLARAMSLFGQKYREIYAVDCQTREVCLLRHLSETVPPQEARIPVGLYDEAINDYIDNSVLIEDRFKFKVISDFDLICKRLKECPCFGTSYREKVRGIIHHNYMDCARVGGPDDFHTVVVGFANEDADIRRTKQELERTGQANRKKKKVLIVEDNDMNRMLLASLIEDEFEVMSAGNGEEGLKILSENYEDLSAILLDVYMPVCDGFEFLTRQKDDLLLSGVPVLMMTGSDVYEDEIKCLELGASDFIRKPYNGNVIKGRIKSIIRLKDLSQTLTTVEHDEMTGVYTRSAFYHHAQQYIDQHDGIPIHAFAADISRFRMINSIYGEQMGDRILVYLANRFNAAFDNGVVARYGSDQFVGLAGGDVDFSDSSVNELIGEIAEGAPIDNLAVNYGIYRDIDHSMPLTLVCDRAFTALRTIRDNHDKNVAFYDDEMFQQQLQEQMMENSFDEAIKQKEFFMMYQPKYCAQTERIVGAEALVRWKRTDGTMVYPNQFIPFFEKNGLIERLDQYIFREVCEVQKTRMEAGERLVPISINLSRATLHAKETVDLYTRIVKEAGIPFSCVPIELTETAAMQSVAIKGMAESLLMAGFSLHMDDFGTGYSSITSLNMLPFEVLKIDKTITDYIGFFRGEQILKYVISLGQSLNMKVLCEGVETKEQVDFLRRIGCDEIQGYYYSKPQMYEDFSRMVKESQ